jgi:hypothetical protein
MAAAKNATPAARKIASNMRASECSEAEYHCAGV